MSGLGIILAVRLVVFTWEQFLYKKNHSELTNEFSSIKKNSFASKVILHCFRFAFLHSMISPEILRHSINQSDAKQNSIVSWLTAFSRASVSSLVLTLSSHWLFLICPLLVIGRYDHFGLCFKTTIRNALYSI